MYTKFNSPKRYACLMLLLLLLASSSALVAQRPLQANDISITYRPSAASPAQKALADFTIAVKKTPDGLSLSGLKGTAWLQLNFTLAPETEQAIDAFGMTSLEEEREEKDPNLADFLFTIALIEGEIVLLGLEGTAWGELAFTLGTDEVQMIDQFGMVE